MLTCLEKRGDKEGEKKHQTGKKSRTGNRIRYPGRAISGQWKLKFIREVGKTDLKLWEKDWLRREGKKKRAARRGLTEPPVPQLFQTDWNPTV